MAWIWLAWAAAGIFYFTQGSVTQPYHNDSISWQPAFVGWMAVVSICAAFTPGILWLGRRWPLDHERRWVHAVFHLGFAAIFSIMSIAIEGPVLITIGAAPSVPNSSLSSTVWVLMVYGFHADIIRYWAVIAVQAVIRSHQHALELRARSTELAGQLTASRLSALKMQLQPHFLFNTLGAIMVLVQQQRREEAEEMLARLSDMLRLTVDEVHTQEVPLSRELEFLELYLSIEQLRFRDRLQVRIAATPGVSDALVPHMVLQPIVENAIRHGLGASEDPVTIQISASHVDATLVVTVCDDGPGRPRVPYQRKGVGLTNTESRLNTLYHGAATLVVENRLPHGVRVTMTLPFHSERGEEVAWT
jgi:two-component system, LytTR family, sensor kinase